MGRNRNPKGPLDPLIKFRCVARNPLWEVAVPARPKGRAALSMARSLPESEPPPIKQRSQS
eukprot:15468649-Alexandrium_andersonii.AAC.1